MMPGDGKASALAAIAADLSSSGRAGAERDAEKGSGGAHTPLAPENFGERDLFLSLDDEVADFAGHAIGVPARRGRGRPAGSVNRTTKQLQAWLRQRGYRDPAEFLDAIVTTDARTLAGELGGIKRELVTFDQAMEVAKLQKGAAAELMPYFHQRTPQQVEQVGDGARPLILMFDGAPGAVAIGANARAMSVHEAEPNQGDSARVVEASDGAASDASGQALDVPRETGRRADD